jgi:hypothetical protein
MHPVFGSLAGLSRAGRVPLGVCADSAAVFGLELGLGGFHLVNGRLRVFQYQLLEGFLGVAVPFDSLFESAALTCHTVAPALAPGSTSRANGPRENRPPGQEAVQFFGQFRSGRETLDRLLLQTPQADLVFETDQYQQALAIPDDLFLAIRGLLATGRPAWGLAGIVSGLLTAALVQFPRARFFGLPVSVRIAALVYATIDLLGVFSFQGLAPPHGLIAAGAACGGTFGLWGRLRGWWACRQATSRRSRRKGHR